MGVTEAIDLFRVPRLPEDRLVSWFSGNFPDLDVNYPVWKLQTHIPEMFMIARQYAQESAREQLRLRISLGEHMREGIRQDTLYDAMLLGSSISSVEAVDACIALVEEGHLPFDPDRLGTEASLIGLVGQRAGDRHIQRHLLSWFTHEHFSAKGHALIAVELMRADAEYGRQLIQRVIDETDWYGAGETSVLPVVSMYQLAGEAMFDDALSRADSAHVRGFETALRGMGLFNQVNDDSGVRIVHNLEENYPSEFYLHSLQKAATKNIPGAVAGRANQR